MCLVNVAQVWVATSQHMSANMGWKTRGVENADLFGVKLPMHSTFPPKNLIVLGRLRKTIAKFAETFGNFQGKTPNYF